MTDQQLEWLRRGRAAQQAVDDIIDRRARDRQLAEAWDEVDRLRGVVDRLEVEKHDLAERLMRLGSGPT